MQAAGEQTGGLVAAVLGMLGLEEKDVADGDTLESLGMDSMQVAEIRARLQRALGRPMPLEEAGPSTKGGPCYGLIFWQTTSNTMHITKLFQPLGCVHPERFARRNERTWLPADAQHWRTWLPALA